MRLARSSRLRDEESRILPLINVVFLLLVFFMLAGRFATTDPFPVEPPVAAHAARLDMAPVEVLVGGDGTLALDGVVTGESALLASLGGARNSIRIRADGGVPADTVIALMGRLRAAGVERISLVARAGDGT